MARPTDRPRLADLDPETLAATIVDAAVDHLHRHAMRIDPSIHLHLPEHAGELGLRPTAHALAAYAQRGLPVWDWADHGMAADGLLDVVSALYGSARGSLDHTAIDVIEGDPEDEIDIVIVGAAARVRLDRREPITARELAVLAGIDVAHVRRLNRGGELELTGTRPARCAPVEAERWLRARGVPGI